MESVGLLILYWLYAQSVYMLSLSTIYSVCLLYTQSSKNLKAVIALSLLITQTSFSPQHINALSPSMH